MNHKFSPYVEACSLLWLITMHIGAKKENTSKEHCRVFGSFEPCILWPLYLLRQPQVQQRITRKIFIYPPGVTNFAQCLWCSSIEWSNEKRETFFTLYRICKRKIFQTALRHRDQSNIDIRCFLYFAQCRWWKKMRENFGAIPVTV